MMQFADSISYHDDFHLKPVWDGKDDLALDEIKDVKLLSR